MRPVEAWVARRASLSLHCDVSKDSNGRVTNLPFFCLDGTDSCHATRTIVTLVTQVHLV